MEVNDLIEPYFLSMREKKWSTFSEWLQIASRQIRYVIRDPFNWKMSKCMCWFWCKNYFCKHVLAVEFTGEEDNEIEYQQTQTQTKKYSKRRKDDTEDESSYDLFSVEEALPQLTLEQLTDEESLYSLELTDEEQPKKQTPMKQTSKKSPKKKRAYKKSKLVVSQKTPKKRTLRSRK